MKNFSNVILVLLLISILFSFSSCNKNAIIGSVNGEDLSITEFKYFLENTKSQMLLDAGFIATETTQKQIDKFWKNSSYQTKARTKTFNDLVEFKIQYANAKKDNFKLSKNDEDEFNNKFKEQYEENEDFKKHLNKILKITIDEFKELTHETFYVNKYKEQEMKKIEVTDSELEDYYNKNKDKYEVTTVRQILFLTQQKTDKEKEETKKKAEDILKKIQDGEDMAELAKKNSEDPGVIDNKGEYEVKKDGKMIEEFENWSSNAQVGDTGIIETNYGYHVMKCEKKTTFEDFKVALTEAIQREKYLEELENLKNDKSNKIEKNQNEIDKVKFN